MKKVAKTVRMLGLAGCAVIASPLAVAEDSGWYGGVNIGQSRAKIDDLRITNSLLGSGPTTIEDDRRDTGYKLFGGYQFNSNFALEAGYFNLGTFGFTATTIPPGTLRGNTKIDGINLDAVGILPFTEKFSVFGRIGVNYAEARDTFTSTGIVPAPANPTPSKREANRKYGIGLQYNFTEAVGMRAETERYRINDAIGNKGDVDLISVSLVYRFGTKKPAPAPQVAALEPVAAPAPPPPPPPPPVVVAAPPPPPPMPMRVTFSADSLFAFDRAAVTPSGKQALDTFAENLRGARFDVIRVTGHTDRIGPHAYNLKLSKQRAEAVKMYLATSAMIPAEKIETKGVNGAYPVTKPAECKGKTGKRLLACLQPDRRVEVEVDGTKVPR